MAWLRMIPSEDARNSHRGVRRYFEMQGETIELPDTPDVEDHDDEEEEEEEPDETFMEEGLEIDDDGNHD